jgi:hypothetical protein
MGFDRDKADHFFNTLNNRQPALDVLQTQFGLPQCALDLAEEALSLIPGGPLGKINKAIQAGKRKAQEWIKEQKRKIYLELGIIEVDTEVGVQTLVSDLNDSLFGDGILSFLDGLNALSEMFGIAGEVWGTITGIADKIAGVVDCIDQLVTSESLQSNYSSLADQYARMSGFCKTPDPTIRVSQGGAPLPQPLIRNNNYVTSESCVANGGTWFAGVDPDQIQSYSDDLDIKYAQERADIIKALAFVAQAQNQQNKINTILTDRYNDPLRYPEPCFDGSIFVRSAGKTLSELLEGTGFCVIEPGATGYCSLGQAFKTQRDCEDAGGLWTNISPPLPPQAAFRLRPERLDPPISTKGKFILTDTGCYYNTIGGGVDLPSNLEDLVSPSAVIPEESLRWMFEYDPNLGGKGETVTLKEFNEWANTIFDIEMYSDIENDAQIQLYYDKDTFLQQIIGERNRQIYTLSGYLQELEASGYGEDSALIINQKQAILGQDATYENKIIRRKKQIQVGIVLGGLEVGKIPINDFSYLTERNIKVPRGSQDKLVFSPGEVSSIVLPIDTKYGISKEETLETVYLNHLLVPSIGKGSIISAPSGVENTSATVVSLTDNIITRDLIACYNFLDGNLELEPDSTDFTTVNTINTDYNAQIVASSFDAVFPSGVGIAQFKGICSFFSGTNGNPKSTTYSDEYSLSTQYAYTPYKPLSYMRLPEGVDDFESLLYRHTGFSVEAWVHMPTLTTSGYDGWDTSINTSSLHRILLGNENRGGDKQVTEVERMELFQDYDSVKGLLLGFTRDRRFTKNLTPNNNNADNPVDGDLKFYVAPTRSINTSALTFIPRASLDCFKETSDPQRYLGAVMDCTGSIGGARIGDVSSAFQHLAVTFDPAGSGTVSIYCNGIKMTSQNYQNTFGFTGSPNIPSPTDSSSFSYNNLYRNNLPLTQPTYSPSSPYQKDFWNWDGPGAGRYTPWIVGGGYTDGMTNKEFGEPGTSRAGMNFLGSLTGGVRSGLNGMVGSFKLYKSALSHGEVSENYKAQKGFFLNIKV